MDLGKSRRLPSGIFDRPDAQKSGQVALKASELSGLPTEVEGKTLKIKVTNINPPELSEKSVYVDGEGEVPIIRLIEGLAENDAHRALAEGAACGGGRYTIKGNYSGQHIVVTGDAEWDWAKP